MNTEALTADLAALKPQAHELGKRYDEAASPMEREAIAKEFQDLVAGVAIRHMLGDVAEQLRTMLAIEDWALGGFVSSKPIEPPVNVQVGEFVIPREKPAKPTA